MDAQPQAMLCDDIESGRWKHRKHVGSPLSPPHFLTSALQPVTVQCAENIPPAILRLRAAIGNIPHPIKAPIAVTGLPSPKPPPMHVPITYLTALAGSINNH